MDYRMQSDIAVHKIHTHNSLVKVRGFPEFVRTPKNKSIASKSTKFNWAINKPICKNMAYDKIMALEYFLSY